jgi:hypothetical protein
MSEKPVESLKLRLQDSLVRELLRRIDDGEASPADLNVARQLLKDIGVDHLISEAATKRPVLGLLHNLPFKPPEGEEAVG